VPQDFQDWVSDELSSYTSAVLQKFFIACCLSLVDQQRGDLSRSLGTQLLIQILLRTLRSCIDLDQALTAILPYYPNFQANPNVSNAAVWIALQSSYSSDIVVWFHHFFPVFHELAFASSSAFQSICLDFGDILMKR
jgi:hypothetical protein